MKLLIQYKDSPDFIRVLDDPKSIFALMHDKFCNVEWLDSVSLLILVGDQGSIKVFKPETTMKGSYGESDIHTQTV